jgi:hypothetical protein
VTFTLLILTQRVVYVCLDCMPCVFVGGDMNLTDMLNELYHAIDIRNL